VFLGLLGTFWGLIETVGSVGSVIQNLKVGGEAGAVFDTLREGLAAPLSGGASRFRPRCSASQARSRSASSTCRRARRRTASTWSWRTGSPPS